MGKTHPKQLLERVVAFVEEGHGGVVGKLKDHGTWVRQRKEENGEPVAAGISLFCREIVDCSTAQRKFRMA